MERTKRIVMKFGGKCLADLDLIKAVADYLKEYLAKYPDFRIIAVVSAMGSFTDDSLKQITELAPNTRQNQGREVDYVTQAGEGISAGLVAIRLNEIGVTAKSLNALQLNICTTGDYQDARITKIDIGKIEKGFETNDILVVTGFQGVHESEAEVIVTLGRGGSDTTAVALAAVLGCKCEFYKKAKGITAFDPDISDQAKVLNFMTYQDAFNLSTYGYQFLHPRCLEIAQRFGVLLEFKASPGLGNDPWENSTTIGHCLDKIEDVAYNFRAIALKKGIALTTIENVPNEIGWAEKIFTHFRELNLLDFQQIISGDNRDHALINIILSEDLIDKCKEQIWKTLRANCQLKISTLMGLSNLTFIDTSMGYNTGFAYLIGKVLADAGINIEGQYSSGNKIHSQIKASVGEKAVLALAKHFSLIE
ncbi:MAG: hypothetical protein NTX82_03325 [Candidatus Parcubacteria bacterium]|nr:hypothetical protein [Candidatus Parcubacteria bacterium]